MDAMGVCAYLQPVHGGEPAGEEVDIDKSYFDLAEGLNEESDEEGGGEGFYERRLDSEDVQRNWQLLQGVTFERFFAAFEGTPQGRGSNDPDVREYLEFHFASLLEAYRSAADAGAGIRFSAC
jgi:hypothetical protein